MVSRTAFRPGSPEWNSHQDKVCPGHADTLALVEAFPEPPPDFWKLLPQIAERSHPLPIALQTPTQQAMGIVLQQRLEQFIG